jgi:hypothetical protein
MVSWGDAGRVAGKGFNVVANTIGVPLDYMAGKAEGEDDFRAGAGAVASGLGGWKGALAGAGAGSMFGPLGTAVGGIAGGIAGGFAGGWTADRLDEGIRGKNTGVKNNMSQAVQLDNGDVAEVDDNGNLIGWLVKGGVVVAGGNALYGAGRNVAQNVRPMQTYQGYQQLNNAINPVGVGRANNMAAGKSAAGTVARQVGTEALEGVTNSRAGQFIGALPTWGKVAATALLADQTLNGGRVTNTLLRPVYGGADMVANAVGFKTDFDGQNKVSQQQMKQNNEAARVNDNLKIANPYDEAIYQQGFRNRQEMEDYENRIWNRNNDKADQLFQERDRIARRNYMTEFTSKQASDLLSNYAQMPQSVAQSIAAIYQAAR